MKNNIKNSFQFISCVILLFITYLPTLKWMVDRWTAPESYYGHGFLIPIVSFYVLWQRKDALRRTAASSNVSGLIIVAVCILVHVICALLKIYFISGFSFVFAIYGLALFFFGKEFTHKLVFPIFFLLTMIPLPLVLIGNLTVKLKLFATQTATVILNKIGFPSVRDGSIIRMPTSYIAIEAPCSGLRSLISLLTLGLLFAYAMKASYFKKCLLLLSAIPIALAANMVRIIMLATVNDLYGEKVAMGFFHNFSGYFVFAFAFVGLWMVGRMLEPREHEGA